MSPLKDLKPEVKPDAQPNVRPDVRRRPRGPVTHARPVARPEAPVTRRAPQPPSERRRPPRAPFVMLVVGLLGGGLVSLLLLNTVLAQDSFKHNELRRVNEQLRQQADAVRGQLRDAGQPGTVAKNGVQHGVSPDDTAPKWVGGARTPSITDPEPTTSGRTEPNAEVTDNAETGSTEQ
ncbi:hypothetical protein [Herbidospora mongoliensis]|uniref:hypothetical protein n=1 Tax=Herbidospora mongoliensis TaxID=688067 RepID=UPI0008296FD9|nr:hypothetical protein [Herbidospora mongoliensis]